MDSRTYLRWFDFDCPSLALSSCTLYLYCKLAWLDYVLKMMDSGAHFAPHPGPRSHDGRMVHVSSCILNTNLCSNTNFIISNTKLIIFGRMMQPQPQTEGAATLALCNRMADDLDELNEQSRRRRTGSDVVPVELLEVCILKMRNLF